MSCFLYIQTIICCVFFFLCMYVLVCILTFICIFLFPSQGMTLVVKPLHFSHPQCTRKNRSVAGYYKSYMTIHSSFIISWLSSAILPPRPCSFLTCNAEIYIYTQIHMIYYTWCPQIHTPKLRLQRHTPCTCLDT